MSEETESVELELRPGDRIELYGDMDVDSEYGMSASVLFEGTVERAVAETALLEFEENDTTRAEFESLLSDSDGYQVLKEETLE